MKKLHESAEEASGIARKDSTNKRIGFIRVLRAKSQVYGRDMSPGELGNKKPRLKAGLLKERLF
ncbi:MAG: hypothetical protein GTO24_18960 [candidate division Zixibacteria bacterium]|nr:hypothetical protein [candidate division Zixibacteria bacterium]